MDILINIFNNLPSFLEGLFNSSIFYSFLGAIIGAYVTGHFSLKAANKAFENQQKHTEELERKEVKSFLRAIKTEVNVIWDRYIESVGKELEKLPEDTAFLFTYPIYEDFFTIYNNNADKLGKVSSQTHVKQIVKTYHLAKGLADSFKLNNQLIEKFIEANEKYVDTREEYYNQRALELESIMVRYASQIKETHETVKQEIDKLNNFLSHIKT